MCIYALKEIVDMYRELNVSVLMRYLDAPKTFDHVKHSSLFNKLIDKGAPMYIARLLVYWYTHRSPITIDGIDAIYVI